MYARVRSEVVAYAEAAKAIVATAATDHAGGRGPAAGLPGRFAALEEDSARSTTRCWRRCRAGDRGGDDRAVSGW
jgi:hypothetical protein